MIKIPSIPTQQRNIGKTVAGLLEARLGATKDSMPERHSMSQETSKRSFAGRISNSCGFIKVAAAAKAVGNAGNSLMQYVNEKCVPDLYPRRLVQRRHSTSCKPSEPMTSTVKPFVDDQHTSKYVDIAVVGAATVSAGKEFDIRANVYESISNPMKASVYSDDTSIIETSLGISPRNLTTSHDLTYLMNIHNSEDAADKKTTCIVQSKTWNGKPDSVSFRLRAPDTPGTYRASLIVLQNTVKGPQALDRINFQVKVEVRHWWDEAFSSLASKSVSVKNPELRKKLSNISKIFSTVLLPRKQQEACKTEVLATLLVKLQHGNKHEKLIAAAALAEIACDSEARALIMSVNIVDTLSHLAFWGSEQTRAQAVATLQRLAYGNEEYSRMIYNVLERQATVFYVCLLVYIQSKTTKPVSSEASATNDSVHQTGTSYRSNNAGDGPEKTRDRKYWFPRFKSNWLGTYRSKKMFVCCECAKNDTEGKRYKPAAGGHCKCGRDEWLKAKVMEEQEYNSRAALSKQYGGIRYEEAVAKHNASGANTSRKRSITDSDSDVDDKRLRLSIDSSDDDDGFPSPFGIRINGSMVNQASPYYMPMYSTDTISLSQMTHLVNHLDKSSLENSQYRINPPSPMELTSPITPTNARTALNMYNARPKISPSHTRILDIPLGFCDPDILTDVESLGDSLSEDDLEVISKKCEMSDLDLCANFLDFDDASNLGNLASMCDLNTKDQIKPLLPMEPEHEPDGAFDEMVQLLIFYDQQ